MKLECCFFYSSYLKVSICALRRSTISKGWSWYILKLVSRNRGPKVSMLWQSLNLRNLARTGRGLPSFLSFLLLSFLPFLPSSFLPSFPTFFFPRRWACWIQATEAASTSPRSLSRKERSTNPSLLCSRRWNVSNFKFSRLVLVFYFFKSASLRFSSSRVFSFGSVSSCIFFRLCEAAFNRI